MHGGCHSSGTHQEKYSFSEALNKLIFLDHTLVLVERMNKFLLVLTIQRIMKSSSYYNLFHNEFELYCWYAISSSSSMVDENLRVFFIKDGTSMKGSSSKLLLQVVDFIVPPLDGV
jgi:hypothetical protein